MKALVCEVCGGNSLIKKGEYFVCEFCETKYSLEEARILLQGSVAIDYSNDINNKIEIAIKSLYEFEFNRTREKLYECEEINVNYDKEKYTLGLKEFLINIARPFLPQNCTFRDKENKTKRKDIIEKIDSRGISNLSYILMFLLNSVLDLERDEDSYSLYQGIYNLVEKKYDSLNKHNKKLIPKEFIQLWKKFNKEFSAVQKEERKRNK